MHSKPLDIVYNPTTLARVQQFLTSPLTEQHSISQWEGRLQEHTYTTLRDKLGGMLGGGAKVCKIGKGWLSSLNAVIL